VDAPRPVDPPTTGSASDLRTQESVAYQQSVDDLRARGCRCTLRFDAMRRAAIPIWPADAAACPVAHAARAQ
jgi:hypothetical protein